jgi:hypothetical protein
MTSPRMSPLSQDDARRLADGPDHAPAGLLASVVEASRSTGQRPAWLAATLGAPTVATRGPLVAPGRLWLLVGLLVLGLVTVLAVAGTARLDLLVVAPTASPAARSSSQPSLAPQPPGQVFEAGFGISVVGDPTHQWSSVRPGWDSRPIASSFDFAFPACADGSCPAEVISLAVGDATQGVIVDWASEPRVRATCPPEYHGDFNGCATWSAINDAYLSRTGRPITIAGRSMDELVAAWQDTFGEAPDLYEVNGVVWAIGERPARLAAFVVDDAQLVSVTFQPWGPGYQSRATRTAELLRYLRSIRFAVPPGPWTSPDLRPVTTRWLDLELTLSGWSTRDQGQTLSIEPDYGGLPGGLFLISRVALGTAIHVELVRRLGGATEAADVEGASFDELVASVETEIAAGTARREASIDGHRLVGWAVPQHGVVGPLAWIAVLDAGADVYLFQEYYPFDAPFQVSHIEALLDGLRFVGDG